MTSKYTFSTFITGTRNGNKLEVRICSDAKTRVVLTTETGKEIVMRTRWGAGDGGFMKAVEDFGHLADAKAPEMTEAELRMDQHLHTYTMDLRTGEMTRAA